MHGRANLRLVHSIGGRLRHCRAELRFTRARLAAIIGAPTSLIRAWEEDEAIPDASSLAILGRALGVQGGWLLEGDISANPSEVGAGQPIGGTPLVRVRTWLTRRGTDLPKVRAALKELRTVGEKLRFLRRSAQLRQSDIIVYLGLSTGRMTRLEGGHDEPRPGELAALAVLFGVDPSELIS